ncbi:hypothetical protein [Streptomyces sp. NPDC048637]|uniref:hypothetical protein n=1 Tax=Streptomyces sp. NPDC048637 TaxID=3155636 RepID=UPI0034482C54
MDEPMTHPEDRHLQATLSRLLLDHLNAPIAEGCHLRGVLPAPGAVRVAIHACDDEGSETFRLLYEIPHETTVGPAYIPGILRTVLTGTQIYSSDDVSEAMGMTLIRLHPEKITPAPEPEEGQALSMLRALSDPDPAPDPEDDAPFLIGFLMNGDGRLRLYVQHPGRTGIIGADIRLAETLTALIAALPSLVKEEERHQPAPDDPHCDAVVDLTSW